MGKIYICPQCKQEFDPNSDDVTIKGSIAMGTCYNCGVPLEEKECKKEYLIEFENFTIKFTLPVIIGRNYQEELKNNLYISRKHCEIIEENNIIYVIDYSTNGTFINGTKVVTKTSINNGDRIKFANTEGVFKEIS
jgi:DNA-directed RNA polymerase subunit RPC12/RpoP